MVVAEVTQISYLRLASQEYKINNLLNSKHRPSLLHEVTLNGRKSHFLNFVGRRAFQRIHNIVFDYYKSDVVAKARQLITQIGNGEQATRI